MSTITLNRPNEGNGVSNAMAARLPRLFAATSEEGTEATVLPINDTGFCIGRDIKGLHEDDATSAPAIGANNT